MALVPRALALAFLSQALALAFLSLLVTGASAAVCPWCSYAGNCIADNGSVACDCMPGFTGPQCAMLNNQTIPVDNGFKMDDYHVWGSQVVAFNGSYHMIASIYPRSLPFYTHWLSNSQLAYATSPTPEGPFQFQWIVLHYHNATAEHPSEFWDRSVDNPKLVRASDGTWLLFYTGDTYDGPMPPDSRANTSLAQQQQRVGLAWSTAGPGGPYTRRSEPILEPREHKWDSRITTNSAAVTLSNGTVLVMYKGSYPPTGKQQTVCLGVAAAETWNGTYRRLREDPIFDCPEGSFFFEDPSLFVGVDGTFHLIAKDFHGTVTHSGYSGAHAVSRDFVNWNWTEPNPLAYTPIHLWSDGKTRKQVHQERPQVLLDERDGWPSHIYFGTDTWLDGSQRFWNMVMPLRPPTEAKSASPVDVV